MDPILQNQIHRLTAHVTTPVASAQTAESILRKTIVRDRDAMVDALLPAITLSSLDTEVSRAATALTDVQNVGVTSRAAYSTQYVYTALLPGNEHKCGNGLAAIATLLGARLAPQRRDVLMEVVLTITRRAAKPVPRKHLVAYFDACWAITGVAQPPKTALDKLRGKPRFANIEAIRATILRGSTETYIRNPDAVTLAWHVHELLQEA